MAPNYICWFEELYRSPQQAAGKLDDVKRAMRLGIER
jgi:hypothetical protein